MRNTRVLAAAALLDMDQYRRGRSRATSKNMLIRIRNLVLYLLLACLPLQSVAGPAHLLVCDDGTPAAAGGSHVHDNGDEHPAHEGPNDQGATSSNDCCQQYFLGVPHTHAVDAGRTGIVYVRAGSAGFWSFNPEPLKRPPRTALAV